VYDAEPKITPVDGVDVTAIRFDGRENDGVAFFQAEFVLSGVAYRVELHDSEEAGGARLSGIVFSIIKSGAADLSALENPDVPELRFDQLTLDAARQEPDFGAFIPNHIPDGFVFESAYRVVRPDTNSLSVHWGRPDNYLEINISEVRERDLERVVRPDEREKYDMSLYPIPLSESVPNELWEVMTSPVFRSDELTLELVRARAYLSGERGESGVWRMDFSVLFDGALMRVTVKGVSPEQVWDMLREL
ncbi:MAG: hypothetical protein LBT12_07790, partial [Oscillospiraceae bacterium]|nr:hypothetical protein [Oscillospiraceae bacterium]